MSVFRMIKGGRCSCGAGGGAPACSCQRDDRYSFSFRWAGKQYTRRTDVTSKAEAERLERAYIKGLRSQRGAEVLAFLQGDESRMRRVCASVGEVIDAYVLAAACWLKDGRQARQNVTRLLQVCAYAWDMWSVNDGGRQGIRVGAEVPDERRIRAASAGLLDSEQFVRAYCLARQQEVGLATDAIVWRDSTEHAGINSVLDQACDIFSKAAYEHAYNNLSLPTMDKLKRARRLPEGERLPEPFSGPDFARLCDRFDGLRETEPDLWLLNVIARQTGMRPAYCMGLRGSWLVPGHGGRWYIELRARPDEGFLKKRGTLNQFVPISDTLRDLILERGTGLTIGASLTKSGREQLQRRHNEVIKGVVGDQGSHGQGAYRYRDTVASALAFLRGIDAAQKALGHTTSTTTLSHYARALPGVSPRIEAELAAWL